MAEVLVKMGAMIICGVLWRWVSPGQIDSRLVRQVINDLVYYLFLPALVLSLLWRASIGVQSVTIALVAALSVLAGVGLSWLICRFKKWPNTTTGAVILASAFPNSTYLGVPVLESLLGSTGAGIAIQFDLFACTPLLFTVGILIAKKYGITTGHMAGLSYLLRIPAIWAAVLALLLNLSNVPQLPLVMNFLELANSAVIPLMLFVVGLSLNWEPERWRRWTSMIPVVVIQLIIMPLIVFFGTDLLSISYSLHMALVLESAMPTMILGIIICDRFGLDTPFFAGAVTLTTVLSMITLPIWVSILSI